MSIPGMTGGILGAAGAAPGASTLLGIIQGRGLTSGLKHCAYVPDILSWAGSGQVILDRSGGGYDCNRGTTSSSESSDPTANGTPGALTKNEYFSFDSGDVITYDTTVESWMSDLHKTSSKGTIILVCDFQFGTSSTLRQLLFSTLNSTTGVTVESNVTDIITKYGEVISGNLYFNIFNAGVLKMQVGLDDYTSISAAKTTENFMAFSWDTTVSNSGIFLFNDVTATGLADSLSGAASGAASPMKFINNPGSTGVTDTAKYWGDAIWSTPLTLSDLKNIQRDLKTAGGFSWNNAP